MTQDRLRTASVIAVDQGVSRNPGGVIKKIQQNFALNEGW